MGAAYANVFGMVAVVRAPGSVAAPIEAGLRASAVYVVQPDIGRRSRVTDQRDELSGSSTSLKEHTEKSLTCHAYI